jgi:hypothetical protein
MLCADCFGLSYLILEHPLTLFDSFLRCFSGTSRVSRCYSDFICSLLVVSFGIFGPPNHPTLFPRALPTHLQIMNFLEPWQPRSYYTHRSTFVALL